MYVSIPYEPYTQVKKNEINSNGMNLRKPPVGTVARKGHYNTTVKNAKGESGLMAYNFPADAKGLEMAAKVQNPLLNQLPKDSAAIDKYVTNEAQPLYERYCKHCHGAGGKGDGKVNEQYKGVANLTAGAQKDNSSGHIYHVITHGKGRMWPHKQIVTPEERWKIALYVHKLQGRLYEVAMKDSKAPKKEEGKEEEGKADSTAKTAEKQPNVEKTEHK
ncbi:cytochrome C [marine bacterium AO1-C]|nr:cytochrome C [marine bacterium AO1-C]